MKYRYSILAPFIITLLLFVLLFMGAVFYLGKNTMLTSLFLGLMIAVFVGFVVFFIRRVYVPFLRIRSAAQLLSRGSLPNVKPSGSNNEVGRIEEDLNKHIQHVHELIRLTDEMASGKQAGEIRLISDGDEIGRAMQKLSSSLNQTREKISERQQRDEQQNWAAQGLAKFSQLIRNAEDDTRGMSEHFIKELTGYLEVEVGGLFLLTDSKDALFLSGAYAFDRNKKLNRSFSFGEGLVGRCAVEKEPIIITDLPPDYIRIRSGLGEDVPAALVLVPVCLDQEVLGVIEIASFQNIPKYKIDFLSNLANSIAPTLQK